MKLPPLALILLATLPAAAAPPPDLQIERREVVVLSVRPMTASGDDRGKSLTLRLDSAAPERGRLSFDWPTEGAACHLDLSLREGTGLLSQVRKVRLDARLELSDGSRIEAGRELTIRGETTALFEIYRLGDRSLTLAVQADLESETTYRARPTATRPVRLRLEIDRVEGAATTPLESNTLHTFLGRSVSYSFDLGESEETDALKIEMLPRSLAGGILTMEVTLSGRIATEAGASWTSQSQQILSSAGIETIVPVAAGSPPVGYRFRITPRF